LQLFTGEGRVAGGVSSGPVGKEIETQEKDQGEKGGKYKKKGSNQKPKEIGGTDENPCRDAHPAPKRNAGVVWVPGATRTCKTEKD